MRLPEDCAQLSTRFLGVYTQCEGIVEDIGLVYLKLVPESVLDALLARRPWAADAASKLLKAVLDREPFDEWVPELFKYVGPGRTYPFTAEWQWATRVRNDLAHSTGVEISTDLLAEPGERTAWFLVPRSPRYQLRELDEFVIPAGLRAHVERAHELTRALTELACYLGIRDRGWEDPGPVPEA